MPWWFDIGFSLAIGFSLILIVWRGVVAIYSDQPYSNSRQRSIDLLKRCLSPEQLTQYERFGWFYVVGSYSGYRYRITDDPIYNVVEIGPQRRRLCFVPEGLLPIGDRMLAQKIALENDELGALAIANKTSVTNSLFDELAGVYSTSSVMSNRQLNETVGGMRDPAMRR